MKPIKIAEIKLYMSKLRKYEGFCAKKKYGYEIRLDIGEIDSHEEFLSTLIHELAHACFDLIRNKNLVFLLSKSNIDEEKDLKVIHVSGSKLDKIEEIMCQKIEKEFLKIFKNYRNKF
jgi:hypothetical protein